MTKLTEPPKNEAIIRNAILDYRDAVLSGDKERIKKYYDELFSVASSEPSAPPVSVTLAALCGTFRISAKRSELHGKQGVEYRKGSSWTFVPGAPPSDSRTDTERLDWMIEHQAYVQPCPVFNGGGGGFVCDGGDVEDYGETPREAIDAAMQSTHTDRDTR